MRTILHFAAYFLLSMHKIILFYCFRCNLVKKCQNNENLFAFRPKKNHLERIPPPPGRDKNDDPCIVDALADKLFPELSLHQKPGKEKSSSQNFAIVRIGKGERTIEFPAIQVDQNYPAILNELVTHM